MTEEQIDLLIKYINAKIAEHAAEQSYDGGLSEMVLANKIEKELRSALQQKDSE